MMKSKIIKEDCLNILNNFDGLRMLLGSTFLITGSNGLIGNYWVSLLHEVNKYYNGNIKGYCISKHSPKWTNKQFTFITQDLSKPFHFNKKVDFIIHCATYPRPRLFPTNELETIALNVDTTRALLEIARKSKAKFLFLSSSEVYGKATVIPTPESYTNTFQTSSIRGAYVESKRLGEVLCYIYHRNYNVDAKIARVSLAYGPGISIHDERAMGDFLRMALIDKHIKLLDGGQGQRTYCYITDAMKIMLHILLASKEIVYNVGGIETVRILDMAKMIAEQCGATVSTTPLGYMEDAPDRVQMDISRVCNEFGLKDFVSLKDGISKTIQWNKEQGYVHG